MGFLVLLKFALLCIHFIAWPVIALGYPLIPFWSIVKLIAIFWLAIPRFHGACFAYQSFIRPCLVVNLQEVISTFEKRCTKEMFIDVADKYIKENGFEALEKLIDTKRKSKEPELSQRDTQAIESDDQKNAADTSKQPKEPVAAQEDNEILEAPETIPATEPKQAEEKKIEQQEWNCTLCQVTTLSEKNLNDHLRGKKHKSMCESLKSSKLNESEQKSCKKPEERVPNQGSSSNEQKGTQHFCFVCKLLLSDVTLASHLNGKRHASNVKKMSS